MDFDYEISADDYTDASVIYFRLSRKWQHDSQWLVAGAILLVVALFERDRGVSPILLGSIGIWWMWAGLGRMFPRVFRLYYRLYYKRLGLAGVKYRATVNKEGFEVVGENRSWTNRWADVSAKGDDKRVFMLFANGTMFIFAKRYLGDDEQQSLRNLAGLARC